jgi:chorismate mutase
VRERRLLARPFHPGMSVSAVDPALSELRGEIARIDHAIVLLVAARLRAARRAIRLRRVAGEEVTNPSQEFLVIDRARRWADEVAAPSGFVERLMQALVNAGKTWTEPVGVALPPLPETIICHLGPVAEDERVMDDRRVSSSPLGPVRFRVAEDAPQPGRSIP